MTMDKPKHNREKAEKGDRFLLGPREYEYVGEKPVRVVALEDGWFQGRYIKKHTEFVLSKPGTRLGRWMRKLADNESAPPPKERKKRPGLPTPSVTGFTGP